MLQKANVGMSLSILIGLFVIYTSAFGTFPVLINRPVFLGLIILLGIMNFPAFSEHRYRPFGVIIDLALASIVIAACMRVAVLQDYIMTQYPIANTTDVFLAWGLVGIVLELCRRTVGWFFTTLVIASIAYAFFGEYAPGPFQIRGFSLEQITETVYLGDRGIWGSLVGVSATILAVFIMFAGLLLNTGAGQSFIDIATRLGGSSPGGAGKVSTIASGLFGMLAGSSVANVATTGNITIPMMLRLGYPAPLSGAIEAVASTGGQLAPPILGAAAFIMAEFLGVSYWTIAAAAVLPALLFYLSVYLTIHGIAIKKNLATIERKDMPAWSEAVKLDRILPLIMGLGGIVVGVMRGNSMMFAVFLGIAGVVLSYLVVTLLWNREAPSSSLPKLWTGFVSAGQGLVLVGILLAGAQILVTLLNMTGLAGTISSFVTSFAGDNLLLLGVLTACISLIMGMGLPTVAAYVLVASMMVAPLEAAGVSGLAAHMFVLYYASLSSITPPVCVAVFIAAGIAKTKWIDVAYQSLRLGAVSYLIPFLFLYYPGILNQGSWPAILYACFTGAILTISISGVVSGRRILGSKYIDVAIYTIAIALAIHPYIYSTIFSALTLFLVFALSKIFKKEALLNR